MENQTNKDRRLWITVAAVAAAVIGIVLLKNSAGAGALIWGLSGQGAWLMPLVLVASLLDSVHPCSFSILLITIAFLFGMQMSRRQILRIGGVYIAGIFAAYLLIGLGILHTLNFFNIPHFMGKLGAVLLVAFGAVNILNELFPAFPVKLKLPSAAHAHMGRLMEKASLPAAFALGLLVGICQFPCMGGPYLMVIGLLHDQATYFAGFGYLFLYNAILILPLAVVLWIAADPLLVDKVRTWKKEKTKGLRWWAGLVMIVLGLIIFWL